MKNCRQGHDANLEISSTHDVQVNFSVKSEKPEKPERVRDFVCEVVLVNYKARVCQM